MGKRKRYPHVVTRTPAEAGDESGRGGPYAGLRVAGRICWADGTYSDAGDYPVEEATTDDHRKLERVMRRLRRRLRRLGFRRSRHVAVVWAEMQGRNLDPDGVAGLVRSGALDPERLGDLQDGRIST